MTQPLSNDANNTQVATQSTSKIIDLEKMLNPSEGDNTLPISTPSDRFLYNTPAAVDTLSEAKKQSAAGLQGSKNTHTPVNENQGPTNEATTDALVAEGIMSAAALLSSSNISPTGTQKVSTLELTAPQREQFAQLRELRLSDLYLRLARYLPQIQSMYGGRSAWPGAIAFGGMYALVDPTELSQYVAYSSNVDDISEEQAYSCFRPMSDFDGYPTINGTPVWERQEWEKLLYYNAFKLYRDMRYSFYNEADMLTTGRSIEVVARGIGVQTKILYYLSAVYQWSFRCQLYDAWMEAQQQNRQEIKKSLMLDRHGKISQALIQKAYTSLSKNADKMSPRDAIRMLELGLEYERLSLGMLTDKPGGNYSTGGKSDGAQISIINQTNAGNGAMQVTSGVTPQQQYQDNLKSAETLVSVLNVLQTSGAFGGAVTGRASLSQQGQDNEAEEAEIYEAEFTMQDVSEPVPSAENKPSADTDTHGTPGFAFSNVEEQVPSTFLGGLDDE